MATTQDSEWVLQRLPGSVKLRKNGVAIGVADAVEQALTDHAGAGGVREHALADVLEMIAADYAFASETLEGGYNYTQPRFADMAANWRTKAEAKDAAASGETGGGQWSFVPIVRPSGLDEFGVPD